MRALLLVIVVAACGSKQQSAPDAAAICAGTAQPRGAIVLRASDPAAGGKARGLRELASRKATDNGSALAELARIQAASDASAIVIAHVDERARKLREDLEIARVIIETIQKAEPPDADWPFAAELRFPAMIGARGAAADVAAKAAELTKPLADGSALAAVLDRAQALATALELLAAKLAADDVAMDSTEAIKISNIAHGKLNEVIATMNTTGASLAALSEEQDGRRFAESVRLWTRLSAGAARLAHPWPARVLSARTKAFMIAGPRQWVVTCIAPIEVAPPGAVVAGLDTITQARDGLGHALGFAPAPPATLPSLKAVHAVLAAN